jgi:hypothetical protein
MNDRLKVPAFLFTVLGVFALAFLAGKVINLDSPGQPTRHHHHDGSSPTAADDLSLKVLGEEAAPAGRRTLRFQIVDGSGKAVTSYDERHERDLHLILIDRQDPRIYQHVHPKLGADGVWSIALDLGPGSYRMYADMQPTGAEPVVLTADLEATGSRPGYNPLPDPSVTAKVDGFTVSLAQSDDMLSFTVERGGKHAELEPYLGAGGHLVVIGATDLTYLHAHAIEGAGQPVGFQVEFDEPGRYVLHFDFQVDGVVHSATFVYDTHAEASKVPDSEMGEMEGMSGHGH